MKIPFQSELDDLFRSSRGIWLKIAGGAVAGAAVTTAALLKGRQGAQGSKLSIAELVLFAAGAGVIGAIMAIALSLKDVVERRIEQGKPVNLLLKLYFAFRWVSIAVWFVTIMVLVFIAMFILFS
jgi:hypothetical protein